MLLRWRFLFPLVHVAVAEDPGRAAVVEAMAPRY
jgi:hypothetical protein